MFKTIKNALKTPDVRKRLLYTLVLIVLFRLGCYITVPGVNTIVLNEAMTSSNGIAGFIDLISGGAFSRFSVFAMSISPYITASIVVQLLAMIIPSLEKLAKEGVIVTQATSPFFSPEAFWCIQESLKSAGFKHVRPYHSYVPSFGDWGFMLASKHNIDISNINIDVPTKYIENSSIEEFFYIPKDVQRTNIKTSTLNNPEILDYYLSGWKYWD